MGSGAVRSRAVGQGGDAQDRSGAQSPTRRRRPQRQHESSGSARAEGLPRRKILWTYGFRNALLPVVNILGMIFSFLLGANVLIEQVFGWPGIGTYAVEAVLTSDYAAIQGFVVMMAILYILLNLGVDILNMIVDPRVRYDD